MPWEVANAIAARLGDLRDVLETTQAALAIRAGVQSKQFSAWMTGRQRPPKTRLETWAKREGWPLEIFAEGGPMPSDVIGRLDDAEMTLDPHFQGEGLPEDEVLAMLFTNTRAFVRFLSVQFESPVLPKEAKLGYLRFVERMARRDDRWTTKRALFEHLRGLVDDGAL